MNRFNQELQAAISHLGDHIGKYQKLVRALVDLRGLRDEDIPPADEHKIQFVIRRAAEVAGVPVETFSHAKTDENVEGEGGRGGE